MEPHLRIAHSSAKDSWAALLAPLLHASWDERQRRCHCRSGRDSICLVAAIVLVLVVELILSMLAMLVVFLRHGFHLRGCSLDQYRMTTNVLAIHLLGGAEVVVGISEADKSVALALCRALIAYNAGFRQRRILGKRLHQRIVGDFTSEITNEESRVQWVPLEQCLILPLLATTFSNDCLLFAVCGSSINIR